MRPIAVRCTIRRLAAKTAGSHIMETMGLLLAPHQLGYGTPQGAEEAVHAARLFLENLQPSEVILKLDFKNTFNSIWHDKMMNAVRSLMPELTPSSTQPMVNHPHSSGASRHCHQGRGYSKGTPLAPCFSASQFMSSALGRSQTCACSISMMGPWVEAHRRSSKTFSGLIKVQLNSPFP